jgi:hypothetical protein
MAFITLRNDATVKDFLTENCCISALQRRNSIEYEVKWHTGKLYFSSYTLLTNASVISQSYSSFISSVVILLEFAIRPFTPSWLLHTMASLHRLPFPVRSSADNFCASVHRSISCIAGLVCCTTKCFVSSQQCCPPIRGTLPCLRICILSSIRFPLQICLMADCMQLMSGLTVYLASNRFCPAVSREDVFVSWVWFSRQAVAPTFAQTFFACFPLTREPITRVFG